MEGSTARGRGQRGKAQGRGGGGGKREAGLTEATPQHQSTAAHSTADQRKKAQDSPGPPSCHGAGSQRRHTSWACLGVETNPSSQRLHIALPAGASSPGGEGLQTISPPRRRRHWQLRSQVRIARAESSCCVGRDSSTGATQRCAGNALVQALTTGPAQHVPSLGKRTWNTLRAASDAGVWPGACCACRPLSLPYLRDI